MSPSTPSAPRPVPRGLYSATLLETFAAGEHAEFVARRGRPLRPRLARALALADLRPGLFVVDVGCGRGEAAAHAARRGARVIGLDYSPGSLALSRATVRAVVPDAVGGAVLVGGAGVADLVDGAGVADLLGGARDADLAGGAGVADLVGGVGLAVSDATALPVRDGAADRVLLLDVVEHLWAWQVAALLAEARRILQPGGYVIIHTLPNRWALAAAYPWLRRLAPGLPPGGRSAYERAVHVNEQDPWRLRRSLDAAGLEARVWVEDWTTRHAARGRGRPYPDALRDLGYPILAHPRARRWMRRLMATPARWWVANDLFALAWRRDGPPPPAAGRFRPVR